MTLEDLRCLIAVDECRSFSGAARRLGCSQPAVSQHVQRLEAELGVRLFERQPRRALATSAGQALIRAARESLGTLDHAIQHLSALGAGTGGALVVTTGGTTVRHFMHGAVKQFRRAHPQVSMQFRGAMSSAECIEMLATEPIDLAFVTHGAPIDGIRQHPLLELDYVLLTRADHALARRRRLGLSELDGLECIGLVEGRTSRSQLTLALAARGVTLNTRMTVCDWDTAIHLVELGLGSSIVPSWHARAAATRSTVAIPIGQLPPLQVGWATRQSYEPSVPARTFMDLLARDLEGRKPQPGVRFVGNAER